MSDMMHFYDNVSGFFVCTPSEGVQKTQENARLRKVGKVWWTEKRGGMHLSWRCCICPPSEGVRKTQETARLRKVEKVRRTGKCGDRHLSWRCCICPPSEGVRKTRENARLRKVGKVWWTEKRGGMHLSWRCCICPSSEGVRKTQENARLRKVGKVRRTGKCGDRHLSWRCCICPPSEGVQKTWKNARLRKVDWKVDRKEDRKVGQEVGRRVPRRTDRKTGWKQCRRAAGIRVRAAAVVGMLLLCAVSFGYQSKAEELPANGYARQQRAAGDDGNRISGVVVEAGKGTPLTGAVVLYVPAGQEGTEYALTDGQLAEGVDAGLCYGDIGFSGRGR